MSTCVTIGSSLMIGKSVGRVSRPSRPAHRSRASPRALDRWRPVVPGSTGGDSRRLPLPAAVRLCRSIPEDGHPVRRELTDSHSPEASGGKTPTPISQLSTTSQRRRAGKPSGTLAGYSHCTVADRPRRHRRPRRAASESRGRVAIRSPTVSPCRRRMRVRSRAGYMPADMSDR